MPPLSVTTLERISSFFPSSLSADCSYDLRTVSSDDASTSSRNDQSTTTFGDAQINQGFVIDCVPVWRQGCKKVVNNVLISTNSGNYAYKIQRTIRDAIYGKVVHASVLERNVARRCWEMNGDECAIKIMNRRKMDKNAKSRVIEEDPLREMAAMQHLKNCRQSQHQSNVLAPVDIIQDDENVYLILPMCNGGELFDRLDETDGEGFSEEEARHWFRQLMLGIKSLHDAGICHRDISLENTLINDGSAYIIDFGMAIPMPTNGSSLMKPHGTCGKSNYMAPEIYHNESFDGRKVDVWSVGASLFMMLTGAPAYSKPIDTDIGFGWVTSGRVSNLMNSWGATPSDEVLDLLNRIFCVDFNDRISVDEILMHPWVIGDIYI